MSNRKTFTDAAPFEEAKKFARKHRKRYSSESDTGSRDNEDVEATPNELLANTELGPIYENSTTTDSTDTEKRISRRRHMSECGLTVEDMKQQYERNGNLSFSDLVREAGIERSKSYNQLVRRLEETEKELLKVKAKNKQLSDEAEVKKKQVEQIDSRVERLERYHEPKPPPETTFKATQPSEMEPVVPPDGADAAAEEAADVFDDDQL